jgi:hypothetical protein
MRSRQGARRGFSDEIVRLVATRCQRARKGAHMRQVLHDGGADFGELAINPRFIGAVSIFAWLRSVLHIRPLDTVGPIDGDARFSRETHSRCSTAHADEIRIQLA